MKRLALALTPLLAVGMMGCGKSGKVTGPPPVTAQWTRTSGGLAAAISLFRRERSLLLLPVLVWGAIVLLFTLGELGGHGHP